MVIFNGYYDYQAVRQEVLSLKSPVKFTRISSGFNMMKVPPIRRVRPYHIWVQTMLPLWHPIRAVADGGLLKKQPIPQANGRCKNQTRQSLLNPVPAHAGLLPKALKRYKGKTGSNHRLCWIYRSGYGSTCLFRFWKMADRSTYLGRFFQPAKTHARSRIAYFLPTQTRSRKCWIVYLWGKARSAPDQPMLICRPAVI